jgi:GntP family gluconate:H+ symporter
MAYTVPMQLGIVDPALVSLLVGIVVVLLLLVYWDVPAFVGLIIAAFAIGVVSPAVPLDEVATRTAEAFGSTMTGIGIPILMAAIIGKSMTDSGAAQRIVRGFISLVGLDRSEYALFGSSFVMAIPVFFDNVFYLLAPLARSMRARIGGNYTLYIVVVGAAGVVTHGFVPPTPGPLAAAQEIGVNLGITMLLGVIIGLPTAIIAGPVFGYWINSRLDIPLRDSMGTDTEELEEITQRPDEQFPGLFESALPILLAVGLVGANTIASTFLPENATITNIANFIGAPSFALTAAAVAAAITFYRLTSLELDTWSDELTEALRSGGNIAAITSAGGAFGALLAAAGVGTYIASILQGLGFQLLITAWVIATAVRIVQGSATVAILTTAGIVAPLVGQLSVHPAYLVMAIGAGATTFSWYNDSGFWIVKELAGLTQAETLKTWSVLTTLVSVIGIITTLIVSSLFPLT